jgi:hypothetical protein
MSHFLDPREHLEGERRTFEPIVVSRDAQHCGTSVEEEEEEAADSLSHPFAGRLASWLRGVKPAPFDAPEGGAAPGPRGHGFDWHANVNRCAVGTSGDAGPPPPPPPPRAPRPPRPPAAPAWHSRETATGSSADCALMEHAV